MQEIRHKQGDTLRLSVVFRDPETKDPEPMTGKTVSFSTRTRNGIPLKGASIEAINAAGGVFEIVSSASDSGSWPVGTAEADLTVTEPDGTVSSTKSFAIIVERGV